MNTHTRVTSFFVLAMLTLVMSGCAGLGGADRSEVVIQKEMDKFLKAHFETGEFMGTALVARGDKVLHSAGYGMADLENESPNLPETVFRLGSLTKQFTAAAILQLQDQGLLDVNKPVSLYLPDYPHGDEITVHQVLNHTAGIANYTEFADLEDTMRDPTSLADLMARFADMPLGFKPGSQFKYSDSGYVVLTAIIEAVSGQPYADYMAKHIFQPLGLSATGYEDSGVILAHRADGYVRADDAYRHAAYLDMSVPSGGGGLDSTVLDLYRWDRALYSTDMLSKSALESFFAPSASMGPKAEYAYGWAVVEMSGRRFILHDGGINGFSTFLIRYPEEELVVIVLSNVETAPTQAIAVGLASIALGDPYELPEKHTEVEVDSAIYENYIGRYQVTSDMVLTVTTEAGRIFAQPTGQSKFELFPMSETEFFAKVADIELHFQVETDGSVSGLILLQGSKKIEADKIP